MFLYCFLIHDFMSLASAELGYVVVAALVFRLYIVAKANGARLFFLLLLQGATACWRQLWFYKSIVDAW